MALFDQIPHKGSLMEQDIVLSDVAGGTADSALCLTLKL